MNVSNCCEKWIDKTYFIVDEAFQVIKLQVKEEIPVLEIQSKQFSVHASSHPRRTFFFFNSHPLYLNFSKSKVIHIMKIYRKEMMIKQNCHQKDHKVSNVSNSRQINQANNQHLLFNRHHQE